jgi:hypothetical protein
MVKCKIGETQGYEQDENWCKTIEKFKFLPLVLLIIVMTPEKNYLNLKPNFIFIGL